ncbi:MAG: glycosyltransferase family 39 protein [Planctomycetes bacterium]|nr:glycosyltransferase family 39 protein [Planctomycetota bacterium]
MVIRALLLLAVSIVVLLPAWLRADWDGTEGRRVQIALEMLRSGDWMVPTLGGEPTWAKPPLHYWLLALCAKAFGDGYLALRLPSVLGAWGGAWVIGELLRRPFGASAGWVGAFGVLCSPLVVFTWPTAEIDPLFGSLSAVSLCLLATGVARERVALVTASGVVAGLALLQKGPPFFLFSVGAYLVWWRHRRLRFALWHFVPMLVVFAAWAVPLWLLLPDPGEVLKVVNEESVGRISFFQWHHVKETPVFWLRAVAVQLPMVLWCFWEWRGARDARMGKDDLMLRMCSGGVVLSVVLLTFFPGRPTRYLLPNVMLFTFAVSPAVAHFMRHRGAVPAFARWAVAVIGLLGAAALLVLPFVPKVGAAGCALGLAAALLPTWVRAPRHVVVASLVLPVVAGWTVGLERSLGWSSQHRARAATGRLLRQESDSLGVDERLETTGHIDSPLLLATGLWPRGDEMQRRSADAHWLLLEAGSQPFRARGYTLRLQLSAIGKTFQLFERTTEPR